MDDPLAGDSDRAAKDIVATFVDNMPSRVDWAKFLRRAAHLLNGYFVRLIAMAALFYRSVYGWLAFVHISGSPKGCVQLGPTELIGGNQPRSRSQTYVRRHHLVVQGRPLRRERRCLRVQHGT